MAVRRFLPPLGRSSSRWEMIAIALNVGNEAGFAGLTGEAGFAPEVAAQILAGLTETLGNQGLYVDCKNAPVTTRLASARLRRVRKTSRCVFAWSGEELLVQKLVQGMIVALAVLLGSFQAEAGTVAMTPDGFADLSKFDELEKAVIILSAEKQVSDDISGLSRDLFAGKGGGLKFKKLIAFSSAMFAAEANRVGLERLGKLHSLAATNFQNNIRGATDYKHQNAVNEKIEAETRQYLDSLIDRYGDKHLSRADIDAYSQCISRYIFAALKEKVFGRK